METRPREETVDTRMTFGEFFLAFSVGIVVVLCIMSLPFQHHFWSTVLRSTKNKKRMGLMFLRLWCYSSHSRI